MPKDDVWIYDWARFRQDEIVRVPKDYKIHSVYTKHKNEGDVRAAFSELNSLYSNLYGEMAENPEEYGMPLHEKKEFRQFSQEWRDSGQAPYRPFILLYNLFNCGVFAGNSVNVSIEKYKSVKPPPKSLSGIDQKVKNSQFLFKKLSDYGFVFEGLKNNNPAGKDIMLSYPDNNALLYIFKMLADKAHNTNRLADFLCCSFRLLQDDLHSVNYGDLEDLADKVHAEAEKEFVYKMDGVLLSNGFFCKPYGGYEGPGLAYYKNKKLMESKGPYSFRMVSRSADIGDMSEEKMRLGLRIRNVPNCMEYIKTCPDSILYIFTCKNDSGCEKRKNNLCRHGISYKIDKKEFWRCACCHAPFYFKPEIENIHHYVKLVELGEEK